MEGFFQDQLLELALHQNRAVVQRLFVNADISFSFSPPQPPARRSPKEPGSRAEPLLNAPVRPVLPANPPGAVLAER